MGFLSKLLTAGEGKQLKKYQVLVTQINGLEPQMQSKSDAELAAVTAALKERASNGEDLHSLLPKRSRQFARHPSARRGCDTSTCS